MSSCFSFHRFASISGSPDDVKLAEILIYQMIANQPKLEQIDIFVRAIYIGTYSTTLMAEFYNNVFFTILQVESLEEMAKSLGVFKTGRDVK